MSSQKEQDFRINLTVGKILLIRRIQDLEQEMSTNKYYNGDSLTYFEESIELIPFPSTVGFNIDDGVVNMELTNLRSSSSSSSSPTNELNDTNKDFKKTITFFCLLQIES